MFLKRTMRQVLSGFDSKKHINKDDNLTEEIKIITHNNIQPKTVPQSWGKPILFDEFEAPEISADNMPGILGTFARALARATETSEALSVMLVLGTLSVAVNKGFTVCPKQGWNESLNLYIFIALESGNNKSAVLNQCIEPLLKWEQHKKLMLEQVIKTQNSDLKTQERIIDAMRSRAAKEKDSTVQAELIKEISVKESKLETPKVLPRLFTNDSTPETLAKKVHEQGGRLAIISDEGGIIETLAGLYSGGVANVDIVLKGYDGGHLRVQRSNREFDVNPLLSFVLAAQPKKVQDMAAKPSFQGNGVVERFLYVMPKSKAGFRENDDFFVSNEIVEEYEQKILSLLDIPTYEGGKIDPSRVLSLDSDARATWKAFQASIEVGLRPGGKFSSCRGWGNKICGTVLRIAGLLHISMHGKDLPTIDVSTMSSAVNLGLLLIEHSVATFGLMGADQPTNDAKEVYLWIEEIGSDSFRQSEVTYAMRHKKFGRAENLKRVLKVLIERNIISSPSKEQTRNHPTIYQVNPAILKKSIKK